MYKFFRFLIVICFVVFGVSYCLFAGGFTDIDAGAPRVCRGSISWGDYDNDGDLDLAISSNVYRNDDGTFTNINANLNINNTGWLSWGDYDNDGDLDLVIQSTIYTDNSRIYRNSGGIFSDINAGLPYTYWGSLSWGDYDNDGDLDLSLLGGHLGSDGGDIYRNNNGTFVGTHAVFPRTYAYYDAVAPQSCGDYDNDGDLDLIFANMSTKANIFRNSDCAFTGINAGVTGAAYSSLSWGDYDNDGDLDLMLTGSLDARIDRTNRIYRNDGDIFTGIDVGVPGVCWGSLSWGDCDNDGDLDLAIAGNGSSGNISSIYRNEGSTFSDMGAGLLGVQNVFLSWGDYDNDGDLDLGISSIDGTKIYRNNGNVVSNTLPNPPTSGFSTSYNPGPGKYQLKWGNGNDSKTPQNGLYYEVRVATTPINDNTSNWVVSVSTGKGVGSCAQQTIGNYPHGKISSTQYGVNLGISMNATYYWQVRTIDTALRKSNWSATQVYVPLLPPTSFKGTVLSTGIINWTWVDNSDHETGYKVRASAVEVKKQLASNQSSWIETGLQANTRYTRYVVSYYGSDETPSSSISACTFANPPIGLSKTALYISSVTIQWDNVGAARYAVERAIDTNVEWWQTLPVGGISGTSFTDEGLAGETTYWYRIKSYNLDNVTDGTKSNVIKIVVLSPVTPTDFTGTVLSSCSVQWNWLDNTSSELGYRVKSLSGSTLRELPSNTTYWVEITTQSNTVYTRYVVAYNGNGESSPSNIASALTLVRSPTNLMQFRIYYTSVTLQWDNVGATKYEIERAPDSNGQAGRWTVIRNWNSEVDVQTASFTDEGLLKDTLYWYRIKSYNMYGVLNETPSNMISVLTVPATPTYFNGAVLSHYSIQWNWKDNATSETGYIVMSSTGGILKTLPANTTFWKETGLEVNTDYSRYVVCYNENGQSESSSAVSKRTFSFSVNGIISAASGASLFLLTDRGDVTVSVLPGTFLRDVMLTISNSTVSPSDRATIRITNVGIEITAEGLQPSKYITITMHYLDRYVVGFDESKLVLCRYDETHTRWIPLPSTVYPGENKVVAKTNHLSKFAIAQLVAASDLNSIKIYPNPFTPKRHAQGVTFDNLTNDAEIKIYTITGELVRTVDYTTQNGQAQWDGRNDSGKSVASGVYIALIKNQSQTKKIKFAVEK